MIAEGPIVALAHAAQMSESVRELNHATIVTADFDAPADVYRLVGELTAMAHRLPQLFSQLARITRRISHEVETGLDAGIRFDDAHDALTDGCVWFAEAKDTAIRLAGQLDAAQEALADVYLVVDDELGEAL